MRRYITEMNSRTLAKVLSGCLLAAVWTAPVSLAFALAAANPPAPAAAPAPAVSDDNPYAVIVERNVFHLNPPPPPPEVAKPKVDLPVVKITGFVNIAHKTKALFTSLPKDKKDGPYYYTLKEGEKVGEGGHSLELVKIHSGESAVDILNDGVEVTLTAKEDSYKPPPGQAQGGQNGTPPPLPVGQQAAEGVPLPQRRIFRDRNTPAGEGAFQFGRHTEQPPPPAPQ